MTDPKTSRLSAPLNIIRDYQQSVRGMIIQINNIIRDRVTSKLPSIMDQVDRNQKTDDIGDEVEELFRVTQLEIDREITDQEISRLAGGTAAQISTWNKNRVGAVMRKALGIDLFANEPFLQDELSIWAKNNVNLIKSSNQLFLTQVENIVFDGMRRGLRHEEIAKQIHGIGKDELGKVSRFKTAKNRANLIARDQVNKLNGVLNRLRQTKVGVKKYIWRTVGDDRVRDKHFGWEGDVVEWSKGKPGGIHPGDEVQCRCWPEPIFDDLLE